MTRCLTFILVLFGFGASVFSQNLPDQWPGQDTWQRDYSDFEVVASTFGGERTVRLRYELEAKGPSVEPMAEWGLHSVYGLPLESVPANPNVLYQLAPLHQLHTWEQLRVEVKSRTNEDEEWEGDGCPKVWLLGQYKVGEHLVWVREPLRYGAALADGSTKEFYCAYRLESAPTILNKASPINAQNIKQVTFVYEEAKGGGHMPVFYGMIGDGTNGNRFFMEEFCQKDNLMTCYVSNYLQIEGKEYQFFSSYWGASFGRIMVMLGNGIGVNLCSLEPYVPGREQLYKICENSPILRDFK
ncbi:MAG: hypothetical protein UT02_C0019G0008 [Parcubacteria group bacterium GW2011_GWC2_38_7]|nr:MAG: hypothetical protein UT02_C0019G0008 [Parcubacteria group bacterium GW2011_GWC2_38_7]